jgi:hypothetical protein
VHPVGYGLGAGARRSLALLVSVGLASGCGTSSDSGLHATGGTAASGGEGVGGSATTNAGGVAGRASNAAGGAAGGASNAAGGVAGRASNGGSAGGGATSVGGSTSAELDCRHDGDGKTTLVFVNHCRAPVTFAGSDIRGKTLGAGEFACVDVGNTSDAISSKRYWGYFGNDPGAGKYSLAEFTFNTDFQDFDWYNISYVDAFNVPLQITPVARPSCKTLTCAADFLSGCPAVGQFKDANGKLVSCVSPSRNDGTNPVAQYFESCDDAYAWSGDDQNGTDPSPVRACAGEDWDLVFCPEAP